MHPLFLVTAATQRSRERVNHARASAVATSRRWAAAARLAILILSSAGIGPVTAWSGRRVRTGTVRAGQLAAGIAGVATGVGLVLASDLGAGAWDVLLVGLAGRSGLRLSIVTWVFGGLMLAVGMVLGGRPRIATVASVLASGPIVEATLAAARPVPGGVTAWAVATLGTGLIALGAGAYLTAGCGEGPIDMVFDRIARRGLPLWAVRLGLEATALTAGWVLGGPVGPVTLLATVALAFAVPATIAMFERRGAVARFAPVPAEDPRLAPIPA